MKNDEVATQSSWRIWLYRGVLAFVIGTAAVWTMFVAMRLRVTYELQTDQAIHRVQSQELKRDHDALALEMRARVDELERVLFGDVVTKISKKPPPNKVELYMQNNLKEFRKSQERFERRLFELETRIRREMEKQ